MCGSKATETNGWLELLKVVYRMCLKDTGLQLYLCLYCNVMWDFPCCQSQVKALSEEKESLKQQLDSSTSTVAILQDKNSRLEREVAESKKEQDDLLVLLADQDQKISAQKMKLKDFGVAVSQEMDLGSSWV